MKFIEFHSDKCDECFKCLRNCPTKAIAFVGENRKIIDELCIKCGLCLVECTHGALETHQELGQVIKMLSSSAKVVASVAPSYAGVFNMNDPGQMVTALKQLGFNYVEETARGADLVSKHYGLHIDEASTKNIITTCCPSSTYLLEKVYHKSLGDMIPIVSPMVAHGMDIKRRHYGSKVVFIGPCVAKKAEADRYKDAVDAVITFKELEALMEERSIELENLEVGIFDTPSSKRGKAYPIGGSLLDDDLSKRSAYEFIHVDGTEGCKDFLEGIHDHGVEGYCAEINTCQGGCLNGPEIPKQAPSYYERLSRLKKHISRVEEAKDFADFDPCIDLSRKFRQEVIDTSVDEGEVFSVMMAMEKYTDKDQINCGACGYATCYDKAVAVVQGYSDVEHCLERLKHKVESLQNIIFENSPNAICILDDNLQIQDINPAFRRTFNQNYTKLAGWPIGAIIGSDVFEKLDYPEVAQVSEKLHIDALDKTFFINLLTIEGGQITVGIFTDITRSEQSKQEMHQMKLQTLDTCQSVIEKQMRVAQEIASLLGETTAETKVNLNRLKQIVMSDEGE